MDILSGVQDSQLTLHAAPTVFPAAPPGPVTQTASTNDPVLDLGDGFAPGSVGMAVGGVIQVNTIGDATATYAFKLQNSADGSTNWADCTTTASIPGTVTIAFGNVTLTNNSTSVTLASTAGLVAGMSVTGTGIPAGTTIASVSSSTVIVLSAAATTGTAAGNYVFAAQPVGVIQCVGLVQLEFVRLVLTVTGGSSPSINYSAWLNPNVGRV